MKVLFATGNERKLGEARAACTDFGIEVEQVTVETDEIQHHDPLEITKHKISEKFRLIGKPVVITDTSWSIPAFGGFPGGYMKDVAEWFSAEDFVALLERKKDRRISFTETIAYKDNNELKLFSQEYWGVIAEDPRGGGNSLEQVAEFEGYTLGERHEQGRFSHNPEDYVWYHFAKWYSQKSARAIG